MTDIKKTAGVGPKAAERLAEGNINTAEDLANASIEDVMAAGFTEKRAEKFITAAQLMLGSQPEEPKAEEKPKKAPKKEEKVEEALKEEPKAEEKPKKKPAKKKEEPKVEEAPKEEKPKKKPKKKEQKSFEREDQRSPTPQGIPTKKKRGVQVRAVTEDDAPREKVEKKEGWGVVAKTLTKEEREEKRKRLEEMNKAAKITRPIPTKLEVVKAKGQAKKAKTTKPEKKDKVAKKVKLKAKKKKVVVEYYSQDDLYTAREGERMRGVSSKASGESKPRIELERDTLVGEISSHRRSRRVIHDRQVIVDLAIDASPDSLVGQKVYFTYPTGTKVAGSIAKRFGKSSSKKVLVNFKKGIGMDGIHQKLYIK